jgi:protein-arginine kinase activator protein McsA
MLACEKCEEAHTRDLRFYRMYDTNGVEVVVCELCREDIEDE